MNSDADSGRIPSYVFVLNRMTAGVLIAVLLALAWIALAAYMPQASLVSTEVEVVIMVILLLAALILVSLVALFHT